MKLSFLCPESDLKISVASYMWFLLRILLTLNATKGRFRMNAVHWPERRKSSDRKAWAMFSGNTNWFNLLQRSIGLM